MRFWGSSKLDEIGWCWMHIQAWIWWQGILLQSQFSLFLCILKPEAYAQKLDRSKTPAQLHIMNWHPDITWWLWVQSSNFKGEPKVETSRVTLMHELIQDVITVHQAQNLKPHPALRGWTGALRSGQGRSDVSRKNWYLMGIWKWNKFGVPDT